MTGPHINVVLSRQARLSFIIYMYVHLLHVITANKDVPNYRLLRHHIKKPLTNVMESFLMSFENNLYVI